MSGNDVVALVFTPSPIGTKKPGCHTPAHAQMNLLIG
tara:strand:- start:88 stop:198 length:111 start_codon:yes stop_codon:yes gene_type:complete